MCHRILELYSGIGGMHCALNESGLAGTVAAAVDINNVANEVYHHNFPETQLFNNNIQSLKPADINKLNVDTILMSPPCQPFTRNGKYLDAGDPRTDSFVYLITILDQLNVKYILMENVKGFESSSVRNLFIDKLKECNFEYQEFLLCPTAVGVPNSRLRYYCIARRKDTSWSFKRKDEIMVSFPKDFGEPCSLEQLIGNLEADNKYVIPDKLLRRANLLDICYHNSKRSCCFTKAYSHYIEGTGSVFTNATLEIVDKCFKRANTFEVGSKDFIDSIKQLNLRFFTPKEVLMLMSFPSNYNLPEKITIKQSYRLLGNSINVKVVSELLKILYQ